MNKSRVCIIRRAYYPAVAHVRRNAETLVTAGYVVDLVCMRNQGEVAHEMINGVAVYRLPVRARREGLLRYLIEYMTFFLFALFKVSWLHIRHPYTVVEADSMPDFLVFTGFLPRLMGARLILYLMESMPEMWAQKQKVSMSHWTTMLMCWQERISCQFANAVICCHEMARKVLVGRGIPENKITVILNVPDEQVYQRNRYNNAPNDGVFRLIQHGAMIESYGIQVVLQALKLSDPALPIHFDILGVGEYRPVLESMVCEMGLEDRVTFHGFVSRERLLELLHRANAGLVPMLFEYQSPSKMFEFVALGKPVIASDRETFRQHFGETEVFYFKTGDARDLAAAIETAFQNRKMMKDYANRATIRYGDYRWQKMKSHYLGLYTRLITELKPKLWILSG